MQVLNNNNFQGGQPKKGELTRMPRKIDYLRDPKYGPPDGDWEEARQALAATDGWGDDRIDKILKTPTVSLSWQLEIEGTKDSIHSDEESAVSSDEDLDGAAAADQEADEAVAASLTPNRRGGA